MPLIYLFIHSVELNLLVRHQVAPILRITDKEKLAYANELLFYFLEANLINSMDIKYTVLLFVPLYLSGQIMQLKKTMPEGDDSKCIDIADAIASG